MVFVCGDTHGLLDIDKLYQLKNTELTYKDYLIICGDAGIVWSGGERDIEVMKWYEKNVPCSVLFVDGNHEGFHILNTSPIVQWNGGNIHVISEQIKHLMRGQVFTLEDKTIFTMGGGTSVDKAWRVEGVSWWAEEMPNKEEYDEANANLKKYGNTVDYIISHDVPGRFLSDVVTNFDKLVPNELNIYFDCIYDTVKFTRWYAGHHHCDHVVNSKLKVLYNDILKIG